jgi:hypothetical protein
MKKIILSLAFIASIFVSSSCSSDSIAPCNLIDLAQKVSDAASAYSSDLTNNSKCLAYKTALNNYKSCSIIDAATKASIESSIAALPCK